MKFRGVTYNSGEDTALPLKPSSGVRFLDRSLRLISRSKSVLINTRSLFFIVLLLVGFLPLLHAQQAAYYPAIPWTRPSANNHPETLPPMVGGCAGLFAAPQAVTVGRTFFDPDSGEVTTSDAVAVPAHYSDAPGGSVSSSCLGDILGLFLNNPAITACQNNICKESCVTDQNPPYPLPPPDKTCNGIGQDAAPAGGQEWWVGFCDDYVLTPTGRDKCFELCSANPAPAGAPPLPIIGGVAQTCNNLNDESDPEDLPWALKDYCKQMITTTDPGKQACKAQCNTENAKCDDITTAEPIMWAVEYCAKNAIFSNAETFKKTAGCFKDNFPESCKKVSTPILVTDGDRDPGDVNFEDNQPDGAMQLIAGLIPDPVDSFFPTTTVATSLFLPVDVVQANLDPTDPALETAILNYFPLNGDYFAAYSQLADGDPTQVFKFMIGLMPLPFPGFLSDPAYQQQNAPIFGVADHFQAGVEQDGGLKLNLQNECTSGGDPVAKSYKNCRSSPVGIQAVQVSDTTDLVVLHQYFSTPPQVQPLNPNGQPQGIDELIKMGVQLLQFIFPMLGEAPVAKDYCSNVVNGVFPGKDINNPSSQPINVNFMGLNLTFAAGEVLNQYKLKTPGESHILGYLTWYKNKGGLEFDKQPNSEIPYRMCVGKSPTHFVVANLDNNPKPDLVVSSFGGFTPSWDPTIFSAFLETAGGFTVIKNYTGTAADIGNTLYLPIAPELGNTHIQHYIDVACGDVDKDGDDDCIATGADGMGLNVHVGLKEWYRVPDVLAAPNHNGIDVNADELGIGDPGDCTFTGPNTGIATCKNLNKFEDNVWTCIKKADKNLGANVILDNPANPEDVVLSEKNDLYECKGKSLDPTCPEFKRENAKKFLYHVSYSVSGAPGNKVKKQILESFVADHKFPIAGANCVVDDVNAVDNKMTCTGIPDFDVWECLARGGPLQQIFTMNCKALTTDVGPAVGQFPDIFGEADDNAPDISDPAAGWEAVVKQEMPISRDALYACGYDFNINRNSELAVYLNPGNGNFNTVYPNLHYVDMAQVQVPRIVPDFPMSFDLSSIYDLKKAAGAIPGAGALGAPPIPAVNALDFDSEVTFNKAMGQSFKLDVKGNGPNNTIGLGVWPFDVELADLVDKMGAPKPDGCADAVVALNNSHYVALIASQCGWEPFKGAPTLYFDASTPKFQNELTDFMKTAIDKVKAGQKLTAVDYLSLLAGLMSGTSYVTVPKDPINGLNEFSQPDARRGIVAIHAFPWRLVGTWINSLEFPIGILGVEAANKVAAGCANVGGAGGGGCNAPGGAGGCAAPAGGGGGGGGAGGGGGGGCSLIMERKK